MKTFEKMKLTLTKLLADQKYICVTCDVWSSRANSFLGATVHLLNCNFERISYVLAFRRLKSKQTHKELSIELKNILRSYEIKNTQVTNVCTDGGSAFCKASRIFGNGHDKLVETASENFNPYKPIEDVEADLTVQSMPYMTEEDGEAFCSNILTFGTEVLEEHKDGNSSNDSNDIQEEDFLPGNLDSIESETDDLLADKDNSNEGHFTDLPPQQRCLSSDSYQ